MAEQADALQATAAQQRRTLSEAIKVTADGAVFEQFLLPVAVSFQKQNPGIGVEEVA